MFKTSLLTSENVRAFIQKALTNKTNVLQAAQQLSKVFSLEDRAAILDYLALVPKIEEKFQTSLFLLTDKLALEQSTAADLGKAKNFFWNLLPPDSRVHDLCCGMGGDSFFLPPSFNVIGIDLSEDRLAMYRENLTQFGRNFKTLCTDARTAWNSEFPADYFTIDPARRLQENENQRCLENLTPTWGEILELASHYKGGAAKLPPAFPTELLPENTELVYLGSKSDCREALVLFGALAKFPNKTRAIMVQKDGSVFAEWISEKNRNEIQAVLPISAPRHFLTEPVPLLVRSHLFEMIAEKENAALLSEKIAYLTSDFPIFQPGFRNFKILAYCPLTTSAVRSMLKAHQIGKLTLKKRGVEIVPEQEIKRLAPKGENAGILFYTRLKGEKTAILTEEIFTAPQEKPF